MKRKIQQYMVELKLGALKVLTYQEFLNFFIDHTKKTHSENQGVFSYKTYLRIKPFLPEDCSLYWDMIYEDFDYDGKKLIHSKILETNVSQRTIITRNEYLKTEEQYQETVKRIEQVKYHYFYVDLFQIHQISHTYDFLFLCNLKLEKEMEDPFSFYVMTKLSSILKRDAQVLLSYFISSPGKDVACKISLVSLSKGTYRIHRRESFEWFGFHKIKDCVCKRKYHIQ